MSQSLAKSLVHIIFSTKDRFAFLADNDIRSQMHAYLATVFKEYDSASLLVGGVADHAHILRSLSRNYAISEIIKEAKQNSSKWIKTVGGIYAKFYWQKGYGALSVSQSQVAQVKRYILDQPQHHRRVTFQDEFREFLKKYEVPYDERYVWD
ncbi:MAG: transposase [Acidobacteriia bacterium]|nr:transposase [Terriglobia bacterium]